MIIAIDFDGTCVTHEFPKIGKDIGAIPLLKELIANGHQLILWTMRSNKRIVESLDKNIHTRPANYLQQAVDWFAKNEIPLYGVNHNSGQWSWTESPKCYAELYIDDAALGCPLVYNEFGNNYVDWIAVREILIGMNLIKI